MEEQDVMMGAASASVSAAPSPTANASDHDQIHPSSSLSHDDQMREGADLNDGGDNEHGDQVIPPRSPGADSISTGAASSDEEEDDDDDDEGGEGNERVDENGAIVIEDDDEDDSADDEHEHEHHKVDADVDAQVKEEDTNNSISIPTLLNEAFSANANANDEASKPSAGPTATDAVPPPTSTPATTSTKPKSKAKPAKARSPSPIPVAPPPLQTVRLTISLGGPDNYAVDIASLAKATGQRPPTPVQKRLDESSDSEGEGKEEANQTMAQAGPGPDKPKKKKKKNAASEYYDVHDPFIDDSELHVDDRKFFAQTKQQGFYVSSGEVALMKDRSPKKPKSKKAAHTNAEAGPSSSQHPRASATHGGPGLGSAEGTKDSPIALIDDDSESGAGASALRPPHSQNGMSRKKKNSFAGQGAQESHSPPAPSQSHSHSHAPGRLRPPPHGTGLAAPISGNVHILRKLNWFDPNPDFEDSGTGAANGNENGSDGYGDGYGDGGERAGMKRKRVTYSTVVENGKKRKVVDISSFHPDLQSALQTLKEAIAQENWEQKGKFPPAIKPRLAEVAIKAIKLDEYDEHFFNLMPTLFPYNKFTMSKLIKRTVFTDHLKLLVERQDALLVELKRQADEGFVKAEEEWEKSVLVWDKRQKRLKAEARGLGGDESGSTGVPTRHPTEDPEGHPDAHVDGLDEDNYPITTSHTPLMGGAGGSGLAAAVAAKEAAKAAKDAANGKEGAGKEGGAAQPPAKKYRLTENMKAIVWELVLISNESCRLENEKNTLEGSIMQVSEQGLRKVLYQKIVSSFPQGWMSSGQISRDVSAMKKRLEKEIDQEQDDGSVAPM